MLSNIPFIFKHVIYTMVFVFLSEVSTGQYNIFTQSGKVTFINANLYEGFHENLHKRFPVFCFVNLV